MCFFSQPKLPSISAAPAVEATPTPTPAPAPTPSTIQPSSVQAQTAEQKRRAISNMRYGLLSTIRTSSQGVSSGPNIYTPSAGGLKTLMGQ